MIPEELNPMAWPRFDECPDDDAWHCDKARDDRAHELYDETEEGDEC